MILPASTNSPAVPRRVVVFGLLLSLSLAVMGIFGSHLVSLLNSSYQEIVTRQLPSIAIMRAVSQSNAIGRRMMDSLTINASLSEIQMVEQQLLDMRDANSIRLAKLESLLDSTQGQELTKELLEVRKRYRKEVDDFFVAMKGGLDADQRAKWAIRLAEADAEYVVSQDRLADYCSISATRLSDVLSERSKRLVSYFMLIAAWPLILAAGAFAYGLASTLVIFYRRNR